MVGPIVEKQNAVASVWFWVATKEPGVGGRGG